MDVISPTTEDGQGDTDQEGDGGVLGRVRRQLREEWTWSR